MIFGVGVDTVSVERFAAKLAKNQLLAARILTPAERELRPEQQAARFAAKEALVKAFGGSAVCNAAGEIVCELGWQDLEVLPAAGARPRFTLTAALENALQVAGVGEPHLSLSHDGDQAVAFVVLEQSEKSALQGSETSAPQSAPAVTSGGL